MEIDINENNKNEEVTYLYHFIPIKYLILLIKNKKLIVIQEHVKF